MEYVGKLIISEFRLVLAEPTSMTSREAHIAAAERSRKSALLARLADKAASRSGAVQPNSAARRHAALCWLNALHISLSIPGF